MNKRQFFLSVVALISLASCSSGASSSSLASSSNESVSPSSSETSAESSLPTSASSSSSSSQSVIPDSPLTLYNANSFHHAGAYNSKNTTKPLATYRHRDYGEVPYVELSQYLPILSFAGDDAINALLGPGASRNGRSTTPLLVEKVADHLYGITRDNVLIALIDTENEVLTLKRYDLLAAGLMPNNNNVWIDIAESNNGNGSCVHTSPLTKVLDAYKDEVYDLKKYHMDIVEAEGKVYFPFQLLDSIAYRCTGTASLYNGVDYFGTGALSSYPATKATCYSSGNTFLFEDVLHTPAEELLDGELYRYIAKLPEAKWADPETPVYDIFSLRANGGGAVFHSTDPSADVPESVSYKLTWEIIDDEYFMSLYGVDPATGQFQATPTNLRVNKEGGFFNTKTRSKALTDFNYDLLRFQFDEFYGLKPDLQKKQGYVDFDSFAQSKGLKERFLSLDATVYDDALAEFTMKYIDDGHTSYTNRSIFSGVTEESASDLVKKHMGPRVTNLKSHYAEYVSLRKEAMGDAPTQVGLFTEGETAVIRFDMFNHFFNFIPPINDEYLAMDPADLMGSSTPYAFDSAFARIGQNDAIKNVVIDLTCNQGGTVLTIPYLAAFLTRDPVLHNREVVMGVNREFHYSVDLNRNGIFGEPEDSFEGKYNFFVLTSDFSFSCGSMFPAVAHDAGVKTIGMQSGGGACSVGCYCDASGSIYNVSSPNQSLYRNSEGELVHNDAGVPVDYPLAKEVWYDLPKLDTFVSSLVND